MREVKEKSLLKERAAETLKSAPQAAFRRGTDAPFQQLRQELRDAAQDGQPEDRYESGKITDTADHAVQEVRHLVEKAVHKLPKTKSESEARTKSVPQSERPQQPSAAPMEYTPQSHAQAKPTVHEPASPIREKPIPPASDKQPKMREHTPTADASVQQSRHPASQIHEKSQVVSRSQEGMEAAMLQNWRNVLAVYAVKVSTDEEHGLDVMTMDEEKLQLLREIFFDANKLEYEFTTRTVDGEQITTLHISAQIKDAMQMADEYSFTAQQREMLEELLKPDYDDIFLSLIGNYQPDGTPIGPVDISDIQGTLPDDLDPLRESIVLTAYQLLGKVTYFWGGKSLVLGWDSRWGTPTTVTAPGSGSTGKVLPFGLDCSGFVDWTFYNATDGAYLPGRGGGAASQHGYCTNVSWSDALPGDLVFYADDSHVGIVCGYDSVGNILVIHCSGGQNGVVVTGREGFSVAARPDLFTD